MEEEYKELDPYLSLPKRYQKLPYNWMHRRRRNCRIGSGVLPTGLIFCNDTESVAASKGLFYYIAIKNLRNVSTEYKLSVREVPFLDLLNPRDRTRLAYFQSVFSDIEGSAVSCAERNRLNLPQYGQFTYGEVEFQYMMPLLDLCKLRPGLNFWDLGCGAGKCLFSVALQHPEFSSVIGIELLPGLYDLCKLMIEQINSNQIPCAKMAVLLGDILEVDWSGADIIYLSSLCFPESLLTNIYAKMTYLKKSTQIITLKPFPESQNFALVTKVSTKMTWGWTPVYIFEKVL